MQTYCKHDKKLKHTDTNKYFETSMTICVIDVLILWMCFMMCVDVLSWHFFMSFFFSMFESMFMFFVRKLCLVFSTIFLCSRIFLRRAYLFLHIWVILRVWFLMIWILCLFNVLSIFLCKFFRCDTYKLRWYRFGTENKS